MTAVPRAVLLILVLVLAACGGEDDEVRLTALPNQALVLAFGDSLTHGTGAPPEASYPAVLEGLIGRRVIRAGVPGEITAAGLKRLPGLLDRYHPALVIICHGGNDILRRRDRRTTIANLKAMIEMARSAGAQVVLVGVPAPGLFNHELADLYPAVATELQVPLEGAAYPEILADKSLLSDQIHPNAKGYRVLAERIAAFLKARGAL